MLAFPFGYDLRWHRRDVGDAKPVAGQRLFGILAQPLDFWCGEAVRVGGRREGVDVVSVAGIDQRLKRANRLVFVDRTVARVPQFVGTHELEFGG